MNNSDVKLHKFQYKILRKLAGNPNARFSDLLIKNLESEHMNYHLKRLVDFGLVIKRIDVYHLTDFGKNYSNLLDDNVKKVEKQPKTSVLLNARRINKTTGEVEHLLSRRLRQPYYGKIGRLTGKVRFGELLQEAAARELYEETGLKAKKIVLERIYHKLRTREDGTHVQDTLFYTFFVTGFYGKFIEKTEFQENLWLSKIDKSKSEYDFFDDMDLSSRMKPRKLSYNEESGIAAGY